MFGGPKKLTDFGQLLSPREAQKPILAPAVRGALLEWLNEIWAEKELTAVGLKPRKRALFTGLPGTGKTTLAHHLAARLGLRMIAVRPEAIIDCWVGSNSRNLGALFDAAVAEKEPIVLLFDEFDSIAGKRLSARTGADSHYNEMVNTLLQRLDVYDGYVIGASNFGNELDEAVWRRFDIHIELGNPGRAECRAILARYFKPYQLSRSVLDHLSASFEGASPALMRQFCEALKRQMILGPQCNWDMGREAVLERILVAVQPHPEAPKARLWSIGLKDPGIPHMPWPLSLDKPSEAEEEPADEDEKVIPIRRAQP